MNMEVQGTGTVTIDPKKWWVVGLLGLISIIAGVLALAYPDITLLVLGLIVGINLVLIGAIWVALATVEEPLSRRPRAAHDCRLPGDSGRPRLPGATRSGRVGAADRALLLVHHHRDGRTVELMAALYMRTLAR
jgi:hypothetical protein